MHNKHPRDESNEDSDEQSTSQPRVQKRRRCRGQNDKKYDAIFELLQRVEERSERMELREMENQREALEQAQKALDSYNDLSRRILHAIVNIGASNLPSE